MTWLISLVRERERLLDYKRFKEICDDVGAYLLSDMAHITGERERDCWIINTLRKYVMMWGLTF